MKKMLNFLLVCVLSVSLMPIKVQANNASPQLVYGDLVTYGRWNNEQLVWQVANVGDDKIYLITYDLLRTKGKDPWSRPRFSLAMGYPELDRMNEPNGFPYLGEETTMTPVNGTMSGVDGKVAFIRKGDNKTVANTYTGSIVQKWLNEDSGGFDAKVFSANEKKAILKTKMPDEQYAHTRSWEGYAFLPSASEIEAYDILTNKARSSGIIDPDQQETNDKIEETGKVPGLTTSNVSSPIGYGTRWWTRTPHDRYSTRMVVGWGVDRLSAEVVYHETVLPTGSPNDGNGSSGYLGAGIRPCINLDPHEVKSKGGNGTLEAPYQLVPLETVKPEATIKPVLPEIKPEVAQEPENNVGTGKIKDIKDFHEKNNNLGAGASTANFPVYLDGEEVSLSTDPMVIKGTTYLPVRALANLLGLKVDYDEEEKVAMLEDETTANRLELPLGYTYALHNGLVVPIDTQDPAKGIPSIEGKSYLPLRFVATALGYDIQYKDGSIYIIQ